jgi:hypothetical protein
MTETYYTDLPNIMHEMIDNEVVVVNLDNGTYYSFDGVGGQVWELLGSGRDLAGLNAAVATRYNGEAATMGSAVARFVEQLKAEGLVRVAEGPEEEATPVDTTPAGSLSFIEPVLHKYTDMEALLLADPIHEVDEAGGWPNLK